MDILHFFKGQIYCENDNGDIKSKFKAFLCFDLILCVDTLIIRLFIKANDMSQQDAVYWLAEIVSHSQKMIQDEFPGIDPIVGINRQLRKQNFNCDLLTIDNNRNRRRITFLLDDALPTIVQYQLSSMDTDPPMEFKRVDSVKVTALFCTNLMKVGLK